MSTFCTSNQPFQYTCERIEQAMLRTLLCPFSVLLRFPVTYARSYRIYYVGLSKQMVGGFLVFRVRKSRFTCYLFQRGSHLWTRYC